MNISKIVRSAKCGVLGALVAMGMTAVAEPTVTVGEVKTGEPWSKITVNYTLGGTDAKLEYKVAFDVTAKGQTASVTNDAAKLTDGAATKEIDTLALFVKQVVDTKAKVKVTLIAVKPKLGGVQLWENGPFFAECNVGASSPEEYGYYFWWGDTVGYTNNGATASADKKWLSVKDGTTSIKFSNESPANTLCDKDAEALADYVDANGNLKSDYDAARAHLGAPWRMMTKDELDKLVSTDYCQMKWVDEYKGVTVKGYVVKGKTGSAYENNEVFFPAAGYGNDSGLLNAGSRGYYWSSTPYSGNSGNAWHLLFTSSNSLVTWGIKRFNGSPVRPVRDAK